MCGHTYLERSELLLKTHLAVLLLPHLSTFCDTTAPRCPHLYDTTAVAAPTFPSVTSKGRQFNCYPPYDTIAVAAPTFPSLWHHSPEVPLSLTPQQRKSQLSPLCGTTASGSPNIPQPVTPQQCHHNIPLSVIPQGWQPQGSCLCDTTALAAPTIHCLWHHKSGSPNILLSMTLQWWQTQCSLSVTPQQWQPQCSPLYEPTAVSALTFPWLWLCREHWLSLGGWNEQSCVLEQLAEHRAGCSPAGQEQLSPAWRWCRTRLRSGSCCSWNETFPFMPTAPLGQKLPPLDLQ